MGRGRSISRRCCLMAPGIGKTRFAMRVASLCNAGFDMLSCGE
ncbi:hypothetical protein RAA17_21650 [Komagataeibacter rhaeticus]|nr:hypothetical protein [Komagataeibacter rhaeticus]